jgi:autophagy-related protein 101
MKHQLFTPPSIIAHNKAPTAVPHNTTQRQCLEPQMLERIHAMEQRRPPEYIIEVFADPSSVKDVVRGTSPYFLPSMPTIHLSSKPNISGIGILHTIFFHRFFPSIRPKTRDVLDLTLPVVEDVELETLIDQRTATLVRQLDTSSDLGARNTGVRGLMAVQFFEKKRRKAWFTKGEEEVCWEQWTLDVTLATPRTESGML